MLQDFVSTATVLIFGWIGFSIISRIIKITKWERFWVDLGFVVHAVFAWIQYYLVLVAYGGGDMRYYYRSGSTLVEWVYNHPEGFTDLLKIATGQSVSLPFYIFGIGTSTGAMSGVGGLALLLTQGSWVAANTLVSLVSYAGLVGLYWSFRLYLGPNKLAIWSILFLPSVTFWASGLQKESLAIMGAGLTMAGVSAVLKGKFSTKLSGSVAAGLGVGILLIFKPYVLVALLTSATALLIRGGRVSFLLNSAFALTAAYVAFFLITRYLPQYELDQVVQQTANLQTIHGGLYGGSNVSYSSAGDATIAGQIKNVPQAAISAFFRPVIFEIHNLTSLMGAIEMTGITGLLLLTIYRSSVRRVWHLIKNSPVHIFCLVFVVVFGIAVGLAAPNLGTLSRYRSPMMPMYAFLALSLFYSNNGSRQTSTSARDYPTRKGFRTRTRTRMPHGA